MEGLIFMTASGLKIVARCGALLLQARVPDIHHEASVHSCREWCAGPWEKQRPVSLERLQQLGGSCDRLEA